MSHTDASAKGKERKRGKGKERKERHVCEAALGGEVSSGQLLLWLAKDASEPSGGLALFRSGMGDQASGIGDRHRAESGSSAHCAISSVKTSAANL